MSHLAGEFPIQCLRLFREQRMDTIAIASRLNVPEHVAYRGLVVARTMEVQAKQPEQKDVDDC